MKKSSSWWGGIDRNKYSKQAQAVLKMLIPAPFSKTVTEIEEVTGSKRVASRIDELRDDWNIETGHRDGRATYFLRGRQPDGYKRPRKIRPTDVETEVMQERRRQVAIGWTAAHDDGHSPDMYGLVRLWLDKAMIEGDLSQYRERMVQVAALAIADVERYDRRFK